MRVHGCGPEVSGRRLKRDPADCDGILIQNAGSYKLRTVRYAAGRDLCVTRLVKILCYERRARTGTQVPASERPKGSGSADPQTPHSRSASADHPGGGSVKRNPSVRLPPKHKDFGARKGGTTQPQSSCRTTAANPYRISPSSKTNQVRHSGQLTFRHVVWSLRAPSSRRLVW